MSQWLVSPFSHQDSLKLLVKNQLLPHLKFKFLLTSRWTEGKKTRKTESLNGLSASSDINRKLS
jgi:hypothetical protein